jgi:hypothetical protein
MSYLSKATLVVCLVCLVFSAGAWAQSAWSVFATGTDSGDYATFVSASADVRAPKALAVRVSQDAAVNWYFNCEGKRQLTPGQVLAVNVLGSVKCSLSANAVGKQGALRLELLRR